MTKQQTSWLKRQTSLRDTDVLNLLSLTFQDEVGVCEYRGVCEGPRRLGAAQSGSLFCKAAHANGGRPQRGRLCFPKEPLVSLWLRGGPEASGALSRDIELDCIPEQGGFPWASWGQAILVTGRSWAAARPMTMHAGCSTAFPCRTVARSTPAASPLPVRLMCSLALGPPRFLRIQNSERINLSHASRDQVVQREGLRVRAW